MALLKKFITIIISGFIALADIQTQDISVIGMADAHCDTVTSAMDNRQSLYENNMHLDFKRLKEFGAPVQVFSIWITDKYLDGPFEYTNAAIDFLLSEIAANSDIIALAASYEDILKNAGENKISAILALEGGEALEGNIDNLEHFYNRGVRIITLTWNRENALGYGAGTNSNKGLKPFGIECVKKMNGLGIIIDVSHLNEAGFWDVDKMSERPYMASHSNAYAITAHKRNLKDAQIKAIAEKGGIIGLNLYPYFLNNTGNAGLSDILAHIKHMDELGVMGNIGLGCDFDGIEVTPKGFDNLSSLKTLSAELSGAYGDDISQGVMYRNFLDFYARFFYNSR